MPCPSGTAISLGPPTCPSGRGWPSCTGCSLVACKPSARGTSGPAGAPVTPRALVSRPPPSRSKAAGGLRASPVFRKHESRNMRPRPETRTVAPTDDDAAGGESTAPLPHPVSGALRAMAGNSRPLPPRTQRSRGRMRMVLYPGCLAVAIALLLLLLPPRRPLW
uniref:NTY2 n=1 Tax=Felis catus TaxID=9685 RepID=A0A3G7HP92_FELCA|nr:NTY2 [Felis catus]AZD12962.1 NTY2 [Felis catus]